MTTTFDRRRFLRLAGAAGLAGAGSTALGSCSSNSSGAGSGGSVSSVALPTYADNRVVPPNLAGDTRQGALSGYFQYPAKPTVLYPEPVLQAEKVSVLTYSFDPVAPRLSENAIWQQINARIGAQVDITYTPFADYPNRFATTIAGGSIPDIVTVRAPQQQMPAMLRATFSDLTGHLAGDAVKKYPNLAGLPTPAWQETVFGNAIWGVPVPRSLVGNVLYVRGDLIEKAGGTTTPANYAEFVETAELLTDERHARWASGDVIGFFAFILGMNRVPGTWIVEGETFKSAYEMPEYEQALTDMRDLVKRGIFHPDAAASANTQRNEWFLRGTSSMVLASYGGWSKFATWGAEVDGFELAGMIPPGRDGGKGSHQRSKPVDAFAAIAKQKDDSRVERLLHLLDWLCAPFGSREYLERTYGVAGQTYALKGTDPILNNQGSNQALVPFEYLASSPVALYQPGEPASVKARFDYQTAALKLITPDPTSGLYSATDSSKGATLAKPLSDLSTEIFFGRQPVSAWKNAVRTWKSGGGDVIAAEYTDAQGQR
ncbi:extracellular solute-binding protein [Kribbella sp. CA-245084]|uniref:extracellular solute-binding protein n=1 Tax=Kribbella sp. CA-245084 TaxID=3239940 RepID=UPI003D90A295